MGIGSNLKKILEERNITVAQLARATDIKPQTLYAMINRDSGRVSNGILIRIARALDIEYDELVTVPPVETIQYSREILDRMGGVKTLREEAAQIKIISNKAQKLNSEGREKVISYVDDLVQIPEYRKKDNED